MLPVYFDFPKALAVSLFKMDKETDRLNYSIRGGEYSESPFV